MIRIFLLLLLCFFYNQYPMERTADEDVLNAKKEYIKRCEDIKHKLGETLYKKLIKRWTLANIKSAELIMSNSKNNGNDPIDLQNESIKAVISALQVTTFIKMQGKDEFIMLTSEEFKNFAAFIRNMKNNSQSNSAKNPIDCDCEIL
jgi:hypothetical protein